VSFVSTLRFILTHPLNRHRRLGALRRLAEWQVGSRLVPGPVIVDFAGSTRMIVAHGSTGITASLYTGLGELEHMAFVGHLLRPHDLFVDIGANIGAYTVLTAGYSGADVVAVEPGRDAFTRLCENVRLNDLGARVEAHCVALSDYDGKGQLTTGLDTMNHLVRNQGGEEASSVDVTTLDKLLAGREPAAIKIDVEGFESAVIAGAKETLRSPALIALVIEMNGSGKRFGYDEKNLHDTIVSHGFAEARYDPFTRELEFNGPSQGDNRIYLRSVEDVRRRLTTAPQLSLPYGRAV
jgi:FkbM family methyltransferase